MAGEDHRYAVDIRVFVSVIVVAMAVSFGVGVGLGPAVQTKGMTQNQDLPSVTSVEVNQAESLLAAQAAADDGELHEPAGQVRCKFLLESTEAAQRFGVLACWRVVAQFY